MTTAPPTGRTAAIEPTPPDLDWIDHAIYDCRIRRHMSIRATAIEVGLHHSNVSRRLSRILRKVTHPEVDEMRTEEGHRLDELADQNRRLVETAIEAGDLDTAQRGLREIHSIARTRHTLFGLNATGNPADADIDRLTELAEAYLEGVAAGADQ
jgi:hypothetical protein